MLKTNKFNRRYYHNLREIFRDTTAIIKQRKQINLLMRSGLISHAFRERIMLTVTIVNGCRYCQYAHAKMALDAGLNSAEVEALSSGMFHNCPPDEVPALLYAQHWAESNGIPDNSTHQHMIETYGAKKTSLMELAMRMIRMGNLLGNTWDYILYRISSGKLGNRAIMP
jgi:AhpD family alkylhydroperoxidase